MVVTLTEALDWLRIDPDINDSLVESLLLSAQEYVSVATNLTIEEMAESELAKTAIKMLIYGWYNPQTKDTPHAQRTADNLLTAINNLKGQ